ncbi:glycosyltransferase family 1 protein [Aureimonas sp. AU20]|uniref:glycosyltransferase family 4 protein n=1 Tax=Aureimonas sp. AU20 TaxID=1349819 RepID=UPI00072144C9|nr:glycosyltransferase family 1 protein [Aureimonas sp. AU20]ALN73501.1 hypothetical protein M673_12325 [Aureimonas sp. AU20]
MLDIALNGRFLTRHATGVDRVAEEIVLALDRLLDEVAGGHPPFRAELLVPAKVERSLSLKHIPTRAVGRLGGHAWEQTELTRAAGRRWLINLCNTAPVSRRRNMVLIHDAQVYQTPESYSRSFRLAYRVLLPLAGRRSAVVRTVSHFSREMLETYGVAPAGKIGVMPNGCDHMGRVEADPTAVDRWQLTAKPYFLMLGSLSAHKNIRTALEAAAEAGVDRLIVAGGGNARVFAQSSLPQTANSEFIGRVSDAELKALYSHARALLFPSFFEGFGLPPLEAMSCGCPVIASTADAVRETCGDAALYADPHRVSEWTAALRLLDSDEAKRAELAEKGHARARQFTWEASARKLLDALAEQQAA